MINILLKKGTNAYMVNDKFLKVELDETLENNSWERIALAIRGGFAPSIWLGQTKEVVGGTYDGYHAQLVDLKANRYARADGNGNTNGVFQFVELLTTEYAFKSTDDNWYGWGNSTMEATYNGTIYPALPTDLKNVITRCVVQNAEKGYNPTQLTSTPTYLFVPSADEVSNGSYGNAIEYTSAYQYYGVGHLTDKLTKYKKGETEYATDWWLRTPVKNNTTAIAYIKSDGTIGGTSPTTQKGATICFAI